MGSFETDVTCIRCKAKVKVKDLRYSKNGTDMICPQCYAKENSALFTGEKSKPEPKEEPKDKSNSTRYLCQRCKFKFWHKEDSQVVLRCPYCGQDDKVVKADEAEKTTEQLLKEADEF